MQSHITFALVLAITHDKQLFNKSFTYLIACSYLLPRSFLQFMELCINFNSQQCQQGMYILEDVLGKAMPCFLMPPKQWM